MGELTRARLNNHLWAAADILRGSIDSSDYKGYIFGFLFLKRLSDRFEEEALALVDEGEDEETAWTDPDYHQFFVPERARWPQIRTQAENIGEYLNKAAEALEEQNATLEGVLAGVDFNDERRLGDGKQRDTLLSRLITHFSAISLKNADFSEPDLLGRAYEFLIERFADDAGKKGGEFYTPKEVVELMVRILDTEPGMRVCDPTCGSGGMLIQSAEHVARKAGQRLGEPINVSLFGQEKNLGTWSICKMNLLLHGLPDARIEKGDTIRDPKLTQAGELLLFDRVIANPPFSLDQWGIEEVREDRFGRFPYGVPPKNMGDYAFVQHMVSTLNSQGMLGVVMPHGVLFRGGSEGKIRQGLLGTDLFEAIIGLPENLFYGTGIPACILVLNRAKQANRRDKVLFIDAAGCYGSRPTQNVLSAEGIEQICRVFRDFEDLEGFSRVVSIEEIRENDYNLNILRYVDATDLEEPLDVEAALARLASLERERDERATEMNRLLAEIGFSYGER